MTDTPGHGTLPQLVTVYCRGRPGRHKGDLDRAVFERRLVEDWEPEPGEEPRYRWEWRGDLAVPGARRRMLGWPSEWPGDPRNTGVPGVPDLLRDDNVVQRTRDGRWHIRIHCTSCRETVPLTEARFEAAMDVIAGSGLDRVSIDGLRKVVAKLGK